MGPYNGLFLVVYKVLCKRVNGSKANCKSVFPCGVIWRTVVELPVVRSIGSESHMLGESL